MRKIFGILPLGMIQIAIALILCILFSHLLTMKAAAAEIEAITIAGSGEYSSRDGTANFGLGAEL